MRKGGCSGGVAVANPLFENSSEVNRQVRRAMAHVLTPSWHDVNKIQTKIQMNHAESIEDFAREMGFDIIFHDDGSSTISRDYYTKSFLDVDDLREELRSIAFADGHPFNTMPGTQRLLARRGSQ
jgi:hypothetical protein